MKTSQNYFKFFTISGSVLAIPGILAAFYGFFLIVPPIFAGFGIWLLVRSYKSLAADLPYRKLTLLATALFNGLAAIALAIILLVNAVQVNTLQDTLPYVLLAYLILCTTIAHLGWRSEISPNLKSNAVPPAWIPPQSATQRIAAKFVSQFFSPARCPKQSQAPMPD